MLSYINNMLDITFSEGQQQVGYLLMFFGSPSSDLVWFSSLYRVLIERETVLTTFQIGLQLPVSPMDNFMCVGTWAYVNFKIVNSSLDILKYLHERIK